MKRILIFISSIILISGCNNFGDTNISPSILTSASTKALLTNAIRNLSSLMLGNNAVRPALYVQHLSEGPYPGTSLYNVLNASFANWYIGPLYDLKTIIDYNESGNSAANANGSKDNQIAVARILKAVYYLQMTDTWGDIPYTEALQGGNQYTPVYDTQQSIYTDLFKELTEAVAQIKTDESAVVGDVLFNGDMNAWKRFANTQRLIMALRLSKADPTKGKTEFLSALAAGVITSNSQNITYTYIAGDPNNYNTWYNNYSVSNRNDYAISTTMTNYMSPKKDPRLPIFGEVLAGGVVKGLRYGVNQAVNIPAAYSRVGDFFRGQGSELNIYNYSQVLFTLAEAAKIGYIDGGDATAEKYYNDAIKASWEYYNVYNEAAYTTYIALSDVKYNSATAIKQIITEKWVNGYLNSWETYNDWRRTGFPTLTAAADAVDSRGIPVRAAYAPAEQTLNKENYNKVVASQGADDNYTKLWWFK